SLIKHLAGFLPGFLDISALPESFLRNWWDKDGTLMLRVLRVYALSFTGRVFMLVRVGFCCKNWNFLLIYFLISWTLAG
ncbi:unnamed protein product, partial [Musa acuminata subsp. burmannicoides]